MNTKITTIIVIIILILIGVWYYQTNKPAPATGESVKIGIATVLSGDFAAAGENMVNAAKLAIEDVNQKGGINGQPLELVIEDAGWDSKTGLAANQKLINADGIKYIIGGTSSNGTLSSAPLVNEKKVLYLTPVTGGTNVDNAGEYVFRIANSDLLAGRDIANAMLKMGFTKVAVVAENTEYTLDIKKTFESTVKDNGGEVVVSEVFQPGTTDFRTLVSKVKAAKPQAMLVLSQTGVGGAYFVKQSREQGVNVPLFSDFTFVVNENAKKIVGSFEGVYFADPDYNESNGKVKSFLDRYQKTYDMPSLIPFHAIATYDSVMIIADALRHVGNDSEKAHDYILQNDKTYHGLMGDYSIDQNGNSNLGFVMKVVKDGNFVRLEN